MEITLTANTANISADYGRDLRVTLDDVSMESVVNECGESNILTYMGIRDVMSHYTAREVVDEITEDEILSVIKLKSVIDYYGIDDILDAIGIAEAQAKWGLVAPDGTF